MIPVKVPPDIIHDFVDNICVVENALNSLQCDMLIAECQKDLYEGKPTGWSGNWSKSLLPITHDIHNILKDTWQIAIDFYQTSIDFVEPYHIKKYRPLNYYGSHTDNYISVSERLDRKLSLVVQLSDEVDYVQGELSIAGNIVSKKRGTAIFFPSNYIHHVNQVKKGNRYVLISWGWGKILR